MVSWVTTFFDQFTLVQGWVAELDWELVAARALVSVLVLALVSVAARVLVSVAVASDWVSVVGWAQDRESVVLVGDLDLD
jgi:hypothetical protein